MSTVVLSKISARLCARLFASTISLAYSLFFAVPNTKVFCFYLRLKTFGFYRSEHPCFKLRYFYKSNKSRSILTYLIFFSKKAILETGKSDEHDKIRAKFF